MVPRKHRVPKAVAPAKTGSTRKMQRKKKRERKKRQPRHTRCSAVLHLNPSTTTTITQRASLDTHDTLTCNLSLARIRHVHVHLTGSQVGRRNRWSPSVKQGRKMRQKVGIQVPQFVPMQRCFFFFFVLGLMASWL